MTARAWRLRRKSRRQRERKEQGLEPITWVVIIGGSVAAALAVVALYSALVDKQAEPVENIINPSP